MMEKLKPIKSTLQCQLDTIMYENKKKNLNFGLPSYLTQMSCANYIGNQVNCYPPTTGI